MAKKKASLGCLFWVAIVLLVLVIILFNLKQVNKVVNETGFDEFISQFIEEKTAQTKEPKVTIMAPEQQTEPPPSREIRISTDEKQTVAPTKPISTDMIVVEVTIPPLKETKAPGKIRKATLYYVKVTDDEKLTLTPVKRSISFSDAPLTSTLEALISLSARELNEGMTNLIPSGTKIREIYVKSNVAYIDFNEEFQFNNMGRVGLIGQLKQIVYTSTEFATVNSVQFLIMGNKKDYLGAEGIYIGNPLSRDSF